MPKTKKEKKSSKCHGKLRKIDVRKNAFQPDGASGLANHSISEIDLINADTTKLAL